MPNTFEIEWETHALPEQYGEQVIQLIDGWIRRSASGWRVGQTYRTTQHLIEGEKNFAITVEVLFTENETGNLAKVNTCRSVPPS